MPEDHYEQHVAPGAAGAAGPNATATVHNHYGTRRHTLEDFPEPATAAGTWLMAQPSRLLDVRAHVVDFLGREEELERLRAWRDGDTPWSALLLHAPGGQGKSRLAAEFAAHSRDAGLPAARRWRVVQARLDAGPDVRAVTEAAPVGPGVVVIVDYADRWAHSELERLLSDPVLTRSRRTRVLLIGRTVRWFAALRAVLADRRAEAGDLPLAPLARDRTAMFAAARDRFGAPDLYDLPDPGAVPVPAGLADHPDFGLTLTVHMAALVAVDAHRRGARAPTTPHELSAYLLDREHQAWQRLFDAARQGQDYTTRPSVMAKTVFTAVLTGAVAHRDGIAALRLLELPGHPQDLLLDHRFCYPPTDRGLVLEPLYPDRLAEDFLALLIPGHDVSAYDPDPWAGDVPAALVGEPGALRATVAARAVTFLASAAERWPHIGDRTLYPLLRLDPGLAVEAGSAALAALAAIPGLPPDIFTAVDGHLPLDRHVDLDVGAAAIADVIVPYLLDHATDPDMRAKLHGHYSNRLDGAGRRREALDHSLRAVALLEGLVTTDRATHLPSLALLLGNHATRLADVGRFDEAATTSRRAVDLYDELAAADPAWLPGLALVVGNHANRLAALGQHQDAVAHSLRALRLHEALVAEDRATHLRGLAPVVRNHSQRLAESQRPEEALAFSQRAVDLYAELAATDRSAFLPDLATAVGTHAQRLGGLGRRDEALEWSRRALELAEELAAANREAHLPRLAAATEHRATTLLLSGRLDEALVVSERAVGLVGELVEANRAAHSSGWTRALVTHAVRLATGRRQDEALRYSHRAVESAEDGARADLAGALWGYAVVRDLLSADLENAALAGSRALALYRELAATEPETFAVPLRTAATTLGKVLRALGREPEAGLLRHEFGGVG
ncbi:hypothetical protein [Saccharothrix sp. HUAS TT1]|uniref:hypothetical protein n=1 Tax=unclassified Saccharothrix TaxID=2593673 RepID=UPI00345B4C56